MYTLTVNGKQFTIPKQNIIVFAMHMAIERGILSGNIHDDKTAITYLKDIGIGVEECESEKN